MVDTDDLNAVTAAWGPCPASSTCTADADPCGGNGEVDVNDMLAVINAWGSCPGYGESPVPQLPFEECLEYCDGRSGEQWLECFLECLGL